LPILREELVFVVSSAHPLATKEAITLEDIAGIAFISFLQGSAMQAQLDRDFGRIGLKTRTVMEMENIESIKALVRAGLGAAVLPACSIAGSQGAMLRPLRLPNFRMERNLALALPKSNALPRAIQKFATRITRGLAGKTVTEIRAELAQH
jgi:DNA-binding transcriptional LysR family regulator